MVMINPDPNQPDTPGNQPVPGTPNFNNGSTDPATANDNPLGSLGSGVSNSLLAPVTGFFNQAEADVFNVLNQIGNSLFYGVMAAAGAGLVVWGVWLLFKDTSGGQAIGSIGSLFATAAAPEAKVAKVATASKAAPKAAPKAQVDSDLKEIERKQKAEDKMDFGIKGKHSKGAK